jgi:hypothetical protein
MSTAETIDPLDRYTEIGELSIKVRSAVQRIMMPLTVLLVLESAYLAVMTRPGAAAFLLIAIGTCTALYVWCQSGIGLPLMPIMAIQSLFIYGLPVAASHENILTYPAQFVFQAGIEVLVFCVAMSIAWYLAMKMLHPSPPVSYAMNEFNREGVKGWGRLGFGMIVGTTGIEVLRGLGLMDAVFGMLPSGADILINTLLSVMSACGFLLISMIVGANEASTFERIVFWVLLVANSMIASMDFILASAAANLVTVAIGLFWSGGRMPWTYVTVSLVLLSFLNTGKSNMRARYWANDYVPATRVTFPQLPAVYAEWIAVSYNAVLENNVGKQQGLAGVEEQKKNQTLLDRIDNLQNLLFVIDATETEHIPLLGGSTYALIPPLLVPRIFWPDKPRAHEGQIILNVHYGRQDLESTSTTYIAWGLLPEAYGNFGPIAGSSILGIFLGFLFALVENLTARKLVMSMEGFLCFSILMNLMNSFEMVASVLVTSTFQSMVIIILASTPFVRRTINKRPIVEED